jgi:hypothetical protein
VNKKTKNHEAKRGEKECTRYSRYYLLLSFYDFVFVLVKGKFKRNSLSYILCQIFCSITRAYDEIQRFFSYTSSSNNNNEKILFLTHEKLKWRRERKIVLQTIYCFSFLFFSSFLFFTVEMNFYLSCNKIYVFYISLVHKTMKIFSSSRMLLILKGRYGSTNGM